MFQDGLIETISSGSRRRSGRKATSILERRDPSVLDTACRCPAIHRPKREASSTEHPFPAPSEPTLTRTENTKDTVKKLHRSMNPRDTGLHHFPFSNFKHSLTLFSKFFASFPHGTCSLSVSRQYLALDGIYHPLQAALPSSPTLREHIVRSHAGA